MRLTAFCLAAALVIPLAPARADPIGIAFVQAEEGTWWCRDADTGKAFGCAAEKCKAGAPRQECHPTRWCFPAGWSGLMAAWLPEFHTTVVICGAPTQAALEAALKATCDHGEDYSRCELFGMIDPDGKETTVENTVWPGPLSAPTAE